MNKYEGQNVKLAYREMGEGKTVILVHGFCGSKDYWTEVQERLSQSFHVIAVDVRGHGDTQSTEIGYSIHDMAEDLFLFYKEKKLQDTYLFGHSMGGYITLDFAKNHPDLLHGFGIVHSTANPDSEEAKEKRTVNATNVEKQGLIYLLKDLIPGLLSKDKQQREMLEELIAIGKQTAPSGAIGALMAMKNRPDYNQVLEDTKLPVLLVAGAKDDLMPPEKVFSVHSNQITSVVIDEAGHMGMKETPERMTEVITEFVMGH